MGRADASIPASNSRPAKLVIRVAAGRNETIWFQFSRTYRTTAPRAARGPVRGRGGVQYWSIRPATSRDQAVVAAVAERRCGSVELGRLCPSPQCYLESFSRSCFRRSIEYVLEHMTAAGPTADALIMHKTFFCADCICSRSLSTVSVPRRPIVQGGDRLSALGGSFVLAIRTADTYELYRVSVHGRGRAPPPSQHRYEVPKYFRT